jgi:chromosome segregation ATPase
MELFTYLAFFAAGAAVGGAAIWLSFRKIFQAEAQNTVTVVEAQRVQAATQLSFIQQKYADLIAEFGRKEQQIADLVADRERENGRRAALEFQAQRAVNLEESLAEIEDRLQVSYDKLSEFAAREATLAEELEKEKRKTAEKLRVPENGRQKSFEVFHPLPAVALKDNHHPFLESMP